MKNENKSSNSGINGVVIAFAIFGILFAAIAFMSAAVFYQILKSQDIQNTPNEKTEYLHSEEEQISVDENENNEPEEMFREYMKTMQQDIKKNWNPPKGNNSKSTTLLFKIAKDGSLKQYSVYKSSGNEEVDEAAIKAIKDTAPFKPLPDAYTKDDIDIQFKFDYNVFKNNPKH